MSTEGKAPAEIYDQLFVRTLFGRFVDLVLDAAEVKEGDRVLDVGCGTGAAAVAVSERVGASGQVSGVDPNEEMLEVARKKDVPIEWKSGSAETIPYEDDTFDSVVSQFAFMYWPDQAKGLAECMRVLKPGGRLSVLVPSHIDHSPGFSVLAELIHRLFGTEIAEGFREPFSSGDPEMLEHRARGADIKNPEILRVTGNALFSTPDEFVEAEGACIWSLGGMVSQDQLATLKTEARQSLRAFQSADGTVSVDIPCIIIKARK